MSRDKLRNKDYSNNSIDGQKIVDESISIDDIKKIGVNNISGASLSYDGITLTPTIKDKIDSITNIADYTIETFTGNGAVVDFELSNTINTAIPFYVFANGVYQYYTVDYTILPGNTTLHFNYIPENGLLIQIIYQKL